MKAIALFSCLALFAAITSAVEIHCNFSIESGISGPLYVCDGVVVSLENLSAAVISGTRLEWKTDEDVTAFWMSHQEILTKIPNGIDKLFANLEIFQWYNGNISTID